MNSKKYVDPTKYTLTELVKDGQKAKFSYYRDSEFWYEHDLGFLFPIPLKDVNGPASRAMLLAEEKAIYLMRWIRKYIESLKEIS